MGESRLAGLLASGKAFADLTSWRKIAVTGADAWEWLGDLVSADISVLRPGRAGRSLLLGPTGGVRAEFTVTPVEDGLLLLQDRDQPKPIDRLLELYVLSSNVEVEDRTDRLALFAFPGLTTPPEGLEGSWISPSCLGSGMDLLFPAGEEARVASRLEEGFARAGADDLETWRIAAGVPKVGVDALDDDLPQECGLEEAVSFGKGCYLGQEAVAKVRNLGHPRRLLLHLETEDGVGAGDAIFAQDREAGTVTSAARLGGRSVVLAKVRWDARGGPFGTASGGALTAPRRAFPSTARKG